MKKKKIGCLVIVVALLLSLCGCKSNPQSTNYSEWVETLNLGKQSSIQLLNYSEEGDGIQVSYDAIHKDKMLEFSELVKKHNAFAESNGDMFNGKNVTFTGCSGKNVEIEFSTSYQGLTSLMNGEELETLADSQNAQLDYVLLRYQHLPYELEEGMYSFDSKVVVFDYDWRTDLVYDEAMFEFLDAFPKAETVILNYSVECDGSDAVNAIRSKNNNLQVIVINPGNVIM